MIDVNMQIFKSQFIPDVQSVDEKTMV